jgi:ribosome-binding factor A
LIRETLSSLIRTEMSDPRLGLVSLTEVQVSPDFRQARIYVSAYGDIATQEQSVSVLNQYARRLRRWLGREIRLRSIPELEFRLDRALVQGTRIAELLSQAKSEDTVEPEDATGGEPAD